MQEYEIGQIIKAKITKIWKRFVYLMTIDGRKCYLSVNEISDFFVSNIKEKFRVGEIKQVQIIGIDRNLLIVSYEQIHPIELKNPFDYKMQTKDNHFDELLDFVEKGIKYGK